MKLPYPGRVTVTADLSGACSKASMVPVIPAPSISIVPLDALVCIFNHAASPPTASRYQSKICGAVGKEVDEAVARAEEDGLAGGCAPGACWAQQKLGTKIRANRMERMLA